MSMVINCRRLLKVSGMGPFKPVPESFRVRKSSSKPSSGGRMPETPDKSLGGLLLGRREEKVQGSNGGGGIARVGASETGPRGIAGIVDNTLSVGTVPGRRQSSEGFGNGTQCQRIAF